MFDAKALTVELSNQSVNERLLGAIPLYSFTRLAEWFIENHAAVDVVKIFKQLEAAPQVMSKKWQALIEQKTSKPLFLDSKPIEHSSQLIHPFILLLSQYARMRYSSTGESEAFGTKVILQWLNKSRKLLEEVKETATKEINLNKVKGAGEKLTDAVRIWEAEGTSGKLLKESLQQANALHTLLRLSKNVKLMPYVDIVLDKMDEANIFYLNRKKKLLAISSRANQYMIEQAALDELKGVENLWYKEEFYNISEMFPLIVLMKNAAKLDSSFSCATFLAFTFDHMAAMADKLKTKPGEKKKMTHHFLERAYFFGASTDILLKTSDKSVPELASLTSRLKGCLPEEVRASLDKGVADFVGDTSSRMKVCNKMLAETEAVMKVSL